MATRTENERLDHYAELARKAATGEPKGLVAELDAIHGLLKDRAEDWASDTPAIGVLGFMVADMAAMLALYVQFASENQR